MCRKLVDDVVLQFGAGDTLSTTAGVPLGFADLRADDEVEAQVLYAADDGYVAVYKDAATSQKADLLRIKVGALASENPQPPVQFLARSKQLTAYCSNAAGPVIVIFRLYRSVMPCRS